MSIYYDKNFYTGLVCRPRFKKPDAQCSITLDTGEVAELAAHCEFSLLCGVWFVGAKIYTVGETPVLLGDTGLVFDDPGARESFYRDVLSEFFLWAHADNFMKFFSNRVKNSSEVDDSYKPLLHKDIHEVKEKCDPVGAKQEVTKEEVKEEKSVVKEDNSADTLKDICNSLGGMLLPEQSEELANDTRSVKSEVNEEKAKAAEEFFSPKSNVSNDGFVVEENSSSQDSGYDEFSDFADLLGEDGDASSSIDGAVDEIPY